MLTFEKFAGINNVLPEHRLSGSDLLQAEDVDIGLTGEISRRIGFSETSDQCHKNLWQADGFMLATCGSELTAIHPGGARHVIHPALGSGRVWYCNLPDGRTTFSNGFIHVIAVNQNKAIAVVLIFKFFRNSPFLIPLSKIFSIISKVVIFLIMSPK